MKILDINQLNERVAFPLLDWSSLYDHNYETLMKVLASKMNTGFKGQTIVIHINDAKDGHRWKDKEITVSKVTWEEHDSNGPVFHATDGQRYQSHPDQKIKVV